MHRFFHGEIWITVGSNPHLHTNDRVRLNFFEQADNGITCTITSIVYAKYVDSTVLLSAVKILD